MPENRETIGQRLKRLRLSRQISLEKAAEATRIRPHYLQALEEDNYSAMASAAQGRGFLRLYADYLGLDLEAAMNELHRSEAPETPPSPPPETPSASQRAAVSKPAKPAEEGERRPFWARLLRRPIPAEPSSPEAAVEPAAAPPAGEKILSAGEAEAAISPLKAEGAPAAKVSEAKTSEASAKRRGSRDRKTSAKLKTTKTGGKKKAPSKRVKTKR